MLFYIIKNVFEDCFIITFYMCVCVCVVLRLFVYLKCIAVIRNKYILINLLIRLRAPT